MDQTRKTRILSQLKDEIARLPPQLGAVAKYIIDNPGDFGIDPIRVSAEKIGVSANSLVRLARQLGFDSFDAFREPFRQALVTEGEARLGEDWIRQLGQGNDQAQHQARLVRNELNLVSRSLRLMSPERIDAALQHMTSARNCYVTATRSSYALAYYFHYVGRMALPSLQLIPRHMNSAIDELNYADSGDVMIAISFTPYSRETIEACKFARDKGVKLILISDSDVVSSDFTPEETLVASVISTHHFGCYAGALAVIESLLAILVSLGGDDARSRIRSYEDLRKNNNAYWIAQKKH